MARLGFSAPNLLEGTEYPLTRLTRDYQLMNSLYRSHWIVRKVIDTIPEDMCKNWINLTCEVTPEQIDQFQRVERRTQTKRNILKGLKWGRLYGGAGAIMLIKGHEDYLKEPLNLDDVAPDAYKGLLVLDRWSGIYPGAVMVSDINSPDFGLPESYRVTLENGKNLDVHHSRVLRFIGRDLPFWEKQAEVSWGISEVEVIYEELKKRDNTGWNMASLIFLANIRVLKMAKLAQSLGVNNAAAQQQLFNTLQAQNWLLSNMGMQVLNADDSFETHSISNYSGLNEIYQSFMLDISGACEIPITKLFGRSPAGMNATGESDLQNYYDTIDEKQESYLRPVFDKLFPVIAMSTWGEVPDDFDYTFPSCRTLSNEQMAELGTKKTESIIGAYNAGLISQKIGMKELKQLSDETGMFSNMLNEDIEKADEEMQQKGEFGDMKGFNPVGGEVNKTEQEGKETE